jgi:hypothetical protein
MSYYVPSEVRSLSEAIDTFAKGVETCFICDRNLDMSLEDLKDKILQVVGEDKACKLVRYKEDRTYITVFKEEEFPVPYYTLPDCLNKPAVHKFISDICKAYETRSVVRLSKEDWENLFGKVAYGVAERHIHKIMHCTGIEIKVIPWAKKAGMTISAHGMLKTVPKHEPKPKVVGSGKKGVYLITDGEFFKIGKSTNIPNRIKTLQTSNPRKLTLISQYDPMLIGIDLMERRLHEHFKESRTNGEWFDLQITGEDFINLCKKNEKYEAN